MKKIKKILLNKTENLLDIYPFYASIPFGCNLLEDMLFNLIWKEVKSAKKDIKKYGKGLKTYEVKI